MFTLDFVAEALQAPPLHSSAHSDFLEVSTDSRAIRAESLFLALQGESFDGHDFVERAIGAGATGIVAKKEVCEQIQSRFPQTVFFGVQDTLEAYRQLAKAWRAKFEIPIAAVAGSVGKTTTKDLVAAMLAGKFDSVVKTQASENGFIGIPKTLLRIRPETQASVVEIGIDDVGAMSKHLALVQPTAVIVTTIAEEHLHQLRDLETVAREELLALEYACEKKLPAIVHADDLWIKKRLDEFDSSNSCFYSLSAREKPQAASLLTGKYLSDSHELELFGLDFNNDRLPIPIAGKHQAANLLGAIAMARNLSLLPVEIQNGLKKFQPAFGRSEIKELAKSKIQFLCDYYNANPASVQASFDLLNEIYSPALESSQRWICLGDMFELGTEEERLHRELALSIIDHGYENVLLLGDRMKWLQNELNTRNADAKIRHFVSHEEMAQFLHQNMKSGDFVLLKGSRGMRMETVWNSLIMKQETKTKGDS